MRNGIILFILICICQPTNSFGQNKKNGGKVFKEKCVICHTVGKGRLVGPDLNNVHSRRSNEWMKKFILGSQKMIKNADQEALAIFEEYNKILPTVLFVVI